MDVWIGIAVNVLLQLLEDQKQWQKHADKLAKVYVRLSNAVAMSPTLAAAVEKRKGKD